MKATKIVRYVLIGILVLIVVVSLLFSLFGDKLIRTAIETGGKKALQVDVRLANISTSLLRGKVELNDLEIDNPEGYQHESFMKIGHAYMNLNTSSLLSDTVEMETIKLDNIHLTIEQKGTTNNLKKILNNLPEPEPTEPEPEEKPKPTEEKPGKKFRIKVLEINNVEVKAKLLPVPGRADTVTLRIKPIRLENLGSEEDIDMAALTSKIVTAISKGIAEQGTDVLPMDMIDSLGDELKKQGEELLKVGKDIGKEATDAIKDIGGLFKKKEAEKKGEE